MIASIPDLLEFFRRYWYEKVGLVIAIIFVVSLEIPLFISTKASLTVIGIITVITGLLLFLFWLIMRRLPKTPKNKIGFYISIFCSTTEEEAKVREDFVLPLRQLISSGRAGSTFHIVEVPRHIAQKIIEVDDAQNLRIKCKAHFLIYGRVRVREIDGENRHFIDLEGVVAHHPLPVDISSQFSTEFAELLPRRLSIPTENDVLSFQFTSEWADVVAKYIIGIAASFSGDWDYSEILFKDSLDRIKTKDPDIPVFQKLHERIPIRISELNENRAIIAHFNWVETKDEIYIDQLGSYLEKTDESRVELPGNIGRKAIYHFLKERDVDKSISLLKKTKKEADSIWFYNMAFLYGYGGDLKSSIRNYRKAIALPVEGEALYQIEDFVNWVLEEEPEKYQLYYCLAFFNWKAKGDKKQAVVQFEKFLSSCKENEFEKERDLANEWLAEIK